MYKASDSSFGTGDGFKTQLSNVVSTDVCLSMEAPPSEFGALQRSRLIGWIVPECGGMPPPLGINGKHYRFVRFDTGGTVNVLNRFEAVSSGAWSPDGIDDLGLPPASHCQFGHKAQTRRCII